MKLDRRARRHRRGQHELMPAQRRLGHAKLVRHARLDLRDPRGAWVMHVEVADRLIGLVYQRQRAAQPRALFVRKNIGMDIRRGDLGLRRQRQRLEAALVVRLHALGGVAGCIGIDYMRVVVDGSAGPCHREPCHDRDAPRGGRHSHGRHMPAATPATVMAAHPQRIRQHHQQHGKGTPVHAEPRRCRQEMAVAVEVGIHDVRPTRETIKAILESEVRQSRREDEKQHHHEVTEVFVVDQRMHRQRQHRDQCVGRKLQHEELEEIMANLDAGETLRQLDGDAANHHHQQQHQLQTKQRTKFCEEAEPRRRGRTVGDVVHPDIAFTPHQFTCVNGGDDQNEEPEQSGRNLEHHVGERIGIGAVDRPAFQRITGNQ